MRKNFEIENNLSDIELGLARELHNLERGLKERNMLDTVIYAKATNINSKNIDETFETECQIPCERITVKQQIQIIEDILGQLRHYRRCLDTLNG